MASGFTRDVGTGSSEDARSARLQVGPRDPFGQLVSFERDIRCNPIRKWCFDNDVLAGSAMALFDASDGSGIHVSSRTDQRRPQAAVDESDLVSNQAANKDLVACADRTRDPEDVLAPRMRPPAAMKAFARDYLGQRRNGSARRLEH